MSTNKYIMLLAASVVAIATPAAAQDVPAAPVPEVTTQNDGASEPQMLSDEDLSALRGGEGPIISNQTLVAITSGNVITGDYVAGNVTLSDFALSNFTGVGNLLINTGGQVSLQSGMNLTINVGE